MGMLNSAAYDAIGMSLIRNGNDLESVSQADITAAAHELSLLKSVKWQYTSFQPLGAGVEKLAYAYNGDFAVVGSYLPKSVPLSAVSYYFPAAGNGVILNDCWVIPKSAKNPVLAHLFMNHFLESQSAIDNFRDVGYQTMLKNLTIDKINAAKVAALPAPISKPCASAYDHRPGARPAPANPSASPAVPMITGTMIPSCASTAMPMSIELD